MTIWLTIVIVCNTFIPPDAYSNCKSSVEKEFTDEAACKFYVNSTFNHYNEFRFCRSIPFKAN